MYEPDIFRGHVRLLVYGAGGHSKVVLDCARASEGAAELAVVDDRYSTGGSTFYDCPVIGGRAAVLGSAQWTDWPFIVAIGRNATRAEIFELLLAHNLHATAVIHPMAAISPRCSVGPGSVVMPRAVINADSTIGRNCIVNTSCIVEHDCVVGDHAHLSPGATLGGGVRVGSYAHVGLGAIVLPGVEIGECAVIGAGAVVLRNVEAGSTVVGVPATKSSPGNSGGICPLT